MAGRRSGTTRDAAPENREPPRHRRASFSQVFRGQKVFYLIKPTPENLKAYEAWICDAKQDTTFFPDTIGGPSECARVEVNDCEEEDELDLKVVVLCIFKGLTEGQRSPSIIFDRILSVIHIDALQMLVLPRLGAAVTDELTDLQVQTLVVIQVLSNYDPHLNDDLHLPKAIMAKMGTQVLSIEVNWNGDLQRRFFLATLTPGLIAQWLLRRSYTV